MLEQNFYHLLYSSLLAQCPRDTGNMVSHISLVDAGTHYIVRIEAPKITTSGFFDYAKAVNYNQQRTSKEARNYMWVERTLKQVSAAIGGNLEYELS